MINKSSFITRLLQKKRTWEPTSAMQHLKKLISLFHKNLINKPTAMFKAIDTVLLIIRPTIKPIAKIKTQKQKCSQPTNNINK